MESVLFFLYNFFAVPAVKLSFFVGRFFDPKMKQGYEGRKNQFRLIESELASHASGKHKLWFHASSVGESEQALPIIEKIKAANSDIFIILSFFSPSGYNFLKKNPLIDLKIYLPLDTRRNARKIFRLIKPDLWFVSKFDVWPNHLKTAASMQIPILLTAATLSANSRRDKGLAGFFNKTFYKYFTHIFPISTEDSERFYQVFPFPEKITITGDTRFDQVFLKAKKVEKAGNIKIFSKEGGLVFIAGSIWPADEKHLLPAFVKLMQKHPDLRAILVPHELHEPHIADIEDILKNAALESERYSDFSGKGGTEKRIAIINVVGMLARIYMQTDFAYIGGSFSSGVHNVMEPAVFGQPVIFGPIHANSFEASELLKIGGAFAIENSYQAETILEKIVTDKPFRIAAGKKAKDLIYNNLGATDKIFNYLKQTYDFIS